MRLVQLALLCSSPTVGAVDSNSRALAALTRRAADDGATLVAGPEQAIGGYPPEDLVQWPAFVDAQWRALDAFAAETADLDTVAVIGVAAAVESQVYNCAAVVHRGRILGLVPKEKLPTYNVFYEGRTFARGRDGLSLQTRGVPLGDLVFEFDFGTVAIEVCEDSWSPDGPMRRRTFSGAELVVNLSASPYRMGIEATRREMLSTRSADAQCTLVYVNAVGGQDGLIYDGGGYVLQNGRCLFEAPRFTVGQWSTVVDLDRTRRLRGEHTTWRNDCDDYLRVHPAVPRLLSPWPGADRAGLRYPPPAGGSFFLPAATPPTASARDAALDHLFDALALGVRSYYEKTGVFRCLGLALSGGRDSMLTLLVAWKAAQLLGGVPVHAFYMPSRHSQAATRLAAERLAHAVGATMRTLPIDEATDRELDAVTHMLGGEPPTELTRQNVQARIRGQRMWNWANSSGALFLQTGDMSEKAVGYTTLAGDLEGALSVIANLPKTVVVALLERLGVRFGFDGIAETLATAPGPELADHQEAERELMPFPVLDACLYLHAGEKMGVTELTTALTHLFPERPSAACAADARRFVALFSQSVHKWVRAPLALHVGSLDLDRERALQLPVVQRAEWHQ
jgi:NAD+ synthase (glutamine-hydrolysing)